MIEPVHLGPGSMVPNWIKDIESLYFSRPWGHNLKEDEHIWAIEQVGFASWKVNINIQQAELLRIGIDSNLHRNGYGRVLLHYSQSKLKCAGIKLLLLEVRISNIVAINLYESEGWNRIGLRKCYYSSGEDAVSYQHT